MIVNGKALTPGKRIRLIEMPDDPDPIKAGTLGTVTMLTDLRSVAREECAQVGVRWDDGRSLSLICPPDTFEIVED